MKNPLTLILIVILSACASQRVEVSKSAPHFEFVSPETVEETRKRIADLPDADVWLNVTGEHMGWLHRNVHKVFPTVNVYRDGPVKELSYALMDEISNFPVATPEGEMPFKDFLYSDQSAVMGMVILYRGQIVFEQYPRQEFYEKPIYWSVAKVLISTLVAILEDRGQIDVTKPIEFYIPELADSSWKGILVRNILDMATGVDCPENYVDPYSCYYAYSQSIGEGYVQADSPDNPYTYVANVDVSKFAEQGTSYEYSGVNTFLLSWLVETITGMPIQDVFSKEIWFKIGAEADASFLAPRFGVPNPSGGFMSRMRDLARFGLLYTPSYTVVSDEKIISDRLIQAILYEGNPDQVANSRKAPKGDGLSKDMRVKGYQWDAIYTNNDIRKGGWGGQGLLINPDKDLVAVYSGYVKDDNSQVNTIPVLRKVLNGVFPGYSKSGSESGLGSESKNLKAE
jgi:CubicO group peptidase (beta-lactamase class C family)